jgi:hypothetical protein
MHHLVPWHQPKQNVAKSKVETSRPLVDYHRCAHGTTRQVACLVQSQPLLTLADPSIFVDILSNPTRTQVPRKNQGPGRFAEGSKVSVGNPRAIIARTSRTHPRTRGKCRSQSFVNCLPGHTTCRRRAIQHQSSRDGTTHQCTYIYNVSFLEPGPQRRCLTSPPQRVHSTLSHR